ncbi:hypothetical protein H072_2724 [Dactylellina haptotyla CBS 200.50]|uniref:Uncharacterized protein n=1 Tax=Dactylellina haptotyla (strain CBS 200.50) TaxID=1284197 RepID=S8AQG7_DACHA|nr:hypothetical protein H072_2724 [Dactylellina haptotyla CBS 200.50]
MSKGHLAFEAKRGFILSQIRLLSQDAIDLGDWGYDYQEEITPATLENVLQRVNRISRRHNLTFYNSAAMDHVAEQLRVLYQQMKSSDLYFESPAILGGRADLTLPQNIEDIPDTWPSEDDSTEQARDQYKVLVARISSMVAGIHNIRLKHKNLLDIRKKIENLEDPAQTIQPNIVFKESELVAELKRTRILAAKLANELEATKVGNTHG